MSNVIPAVESVFALSLYFRKFLIYSHTREISEWHACDSQVLQYNKQYSCCESKEFTWKEHVQTFLFPSSGIMVSPLSSFSCFLIFSTSACCFKSSVSCLNDAIFTKCSSFSRWNSGSTSEEKRSKASVSTVSNVWKMRLNENKMSCSRIKGIMT